MKIYLAGGEWTEGATALKALLELRDRSPFLAHMSDKEYVDHLAKGCGAKVILAAEDVEARAAELVQQLVAAGLARVED